MVFEKPVTCPSEMNGPAAEEVRRDPQNMGTSHWKDLRLSGSAPRMPGRSSRAVNLAGQGVSHHRTMPRSAAVPSR